MTQRGVEVASGARPGFEEFYRRELEWARRLAFLLIGDDRYSDDIVQEAFLRMQSRFESVDTPRAYLRVTIVNACRRHEKKEGRRRRAQQAAMVEPRTDHAQIDQVLALIDRLPSRQRAVLVLRYFEDLSEAEISEVLSCRPGTVKSLSARALARLRKELGP